MMRRMLFLDCVASVQNIEIRSISDTFYFGVQHRCHSVNMDFTIEIGPAPVKNEQYRLSFSECIPDSIVLQLLEGKPPVYVALISPEKTPTESEYPSYSSLVERGAPRLPESLIPAGTLNRIFGHVMCKICFPDFEAIETVAVFSKAGGDIVSNYIQGHCGNRLSYHMSDDKQLSIVTTLREPPKYIEEALRGVAAERFLAFIKAGGKVKTLCHPHQSPADVFSDYPLAYAWVGGEKRTGFRLEFDLRKYEKRTK